MILDGLLKQYWQGNTLKILHDEKNRFKKKHERKGFTVKILDIEQSPL